MDLDEFESYAHGVRHNLNSTAFDARTVISSQNTSIVRSVERHNSSASQQRNYPSRQDSNSSANTPHSSPNRGKKFSSKRIQTIWSTIKKFSPVHRLKSSSRNKRKLNERDDRLYASHPDISYNNLAVLTRIENKRSQDDTDAIKMTKCVKSKQPNVPTFYVEDSDVMPFANSYQQNTSAKEFSLGQTDNLESALNRQRLLALRQHPFYHLEVHLRSASNLLAKDSCGTSDPYVKFRIGNRVVYKSRVVSKCLDPKWDEYFVIPIDDVFQPISIKVYDYDFGFQDDYLGAAFVDLTKLDIGIQTDLELILTETGVEDEIGELTWGSVLICVTLIPKTQEDKEQYFGRGSKPISLGTGGGETSVKRFKTQLWDSVVNIVLVEGKNLLIKDETELSDVHVRFKLGNEKYKSRVISKCSNPVWAEQFDLHTYPDQSKVLEISVYGHDLIGKCALNLNDLAKEETHKIWKNIEGKGSIQLLLTISGTLGSETISDLNTSEYSYDYQKTISQKYKLLKSFKDIDDIGHLTVKVYRAEALAAADIGGKSDPFCVLELVNARLQTNTEYKTLSPEWNKIYSFKVKDIHSVLEITVYDEDRDKKVEFLGKIAIPLLKIKNGEKKWYALKDKKLLSRAKGHILLELHISFNRIKASVRTFNPREAKLVQPEKKFKRTVFIRNVTRLKTLIMEIYEIIKFMQSCFQWESVPRSLISLTIFLLVTYFFELYMAPIVLLLLFIKNYVWITIENYFNANLKEEEIDDSDEALLDDEDDETKNEEKKSLKEKLQTVQEITCLIQNIIGEIASCGERVKNTLNFSVPFLSWLAIICLSLATLILYYIPLRYLIMAWGINKFTKKLRSPNAIDNNELMDFLSRVPDVDEKIQYREYKVQLNNSVSTSDADRKRKKKAI